MASLVPVPASRQIADNEAEPSCWVCLGPGDQAQPLAQPCRCPRPIHQACLARWQLQSVGRRYVRHMITTDPKRVLTKLAKAADADASSEDLVNHYSTAGKKQHDTLDCPVSCSEETACRFCYGELPDWRTACNLPTASPVMTVSHNSVQHLLEVKPGEAGKAEFQQNIRRIFGLSPEDVIELTFGCKAPGTGKVDCLNCQATSPCCLHGLLTLAMLS